MLIIGVFVLIGGSKHY